MTAAGGVASPPLSHRSELMQAQTMTYQCPHCRQPVEIDMPPENEMMACPNGACGQTFKIDVPAAQPMNTGTAPAPVANGTTAPTPASAPSVTAAAPAAA